LAQPDGYWQIKRRLRAAQGASRAKERNKGEDALKRRLDESVVTTENELKLLREILKRI
jgi:hypothetical protein